MGMRIQTTGYIVIGGKKILVLVRGRKYRRDFKLRHSGKDGSHFDDDETYLEEHPELVKALLDGEVISI